MGRLASRVRPYKQAGDFEGQKSGVIIVRRRLRRERDQLAVRVNQGGSIRGGFGSFRAFGCDPLRTVKDGLNPLSPGPRADQSTKLRARDKSGIASGQKPVNHPGNRSHIFFHKSHRRAVRPTSRVQRCGIGRMPLFGQHL